MRKQPRQQRSQALVRSILEATGRVIVARGLAFTTTNHVAEEAGVDIASLYQYFVNKDDLVDELLKSLAEDVIRVATDYFERIDMYRATPAELIRGALTLGLNLARANPVVRELAQHPRYLYDSAGMRRLENQMQVMATAYFRHHFRSYPIENLHTRLHIVSVSAFTLIARHLSESTPLIRDDELIEAMVLMFAPYFERGAVPNETAPSEAAPDKAAARKATPKQATSTRRTTSKPVPGKTGAARGKGGGTLSPRRR